MITIFTPTYNRAYLIDNLYKSLCRQTDSDFEWLIVDDGSTDDTPARLRCMQKEGKLNMRYFIQDNGGKHRAINKGVQKAKGDLFFIVDSDDRLSPEAVERIHYHYQTIREDPSFAGVSGIRAYFTGEKIGGEQPFGILDCNALDLRFKFGIRGDMAEVFKTEILKEYPFPEIEKEKFCPEALVWNRIAAKYKMRYFYEKIYLCNYLPDGLTAKITKLRMLNHQASLLYYSELYHAAIPVMQKIKAATNYWRFSRCSDKKFFEQIKQIKKRTIFLYPLGVLFHLKDKYTR